MKSVLKMQHSMQLSTSLVYLLFFHPTLLYLDSIELQTFAQWNRHPPITLTTTINTSS
jgi:hypothetical protein